jgi:catechol 2,3-dioxygenase-like lactoylglutathione lyase family enzyme
VTVGSRARIDWLSDLSKTATMRLVTVPSMSNVASVTLSCADPARLAAFYREATGYEIIYESDDAIYLAGADGIRIGFDRVDGFERPAGAPDVLPAIRLDLAVENLDQAEQRLLALGATRPGHQLDTDGWILVADQEGHTVCLTTVY